MPADIALLGAVGCHPPKTRMLYRTETNTRNAGYSNHVEKEKKKRVGILGILGIAKTRVTAVQPGLIGVVVSAGRRTNECLGSLNQDVSFGNFKDHPISWILQNEPSVGALAPK